MFVEKHSVIILLCSYSGKGCCMPCNTGIKVRSELNKKNEIQSKVWNMEINLNKLICIETVQDTRLIDPADILYCHIRDKKTLIVLHTNTLIETTYSLKLLEIQVLKNIKLLRCHAKYLVSLENPVIYDSKNRSILLTNGTILPVAKDRRSFVKKALNGSGTHF